MDAAELALVAVADVVGELRAQIEDREGSTTAPGGSAMVVEVLERLEAIVGLWTRTDQT